MKRDADDDTSVATKEPLAGELREARATADTIAMNDVRARAERALFGAAEPARVGRFVLLGPIAGGGMGVVYGAYDPQLDRRVALKVLHPDQHATGRARERLISEARALARLDHPNVVPVHDVVVVDDQVVIVMELVAGQTLAAWERAASRPWRQVVAVYLQAGRGLAAAHQLGVIHRDFKPANAIVGDDGRVRVLDFGLARFTGEDEGGGDDVTVSGGARRAPALTATGEILGTLGYMAPEQLAGGPVTAQSDQFSFCVALHRAIHGVAPFEGTGRESLLAGIRSGRPAHATDGRRVPGWLRAAIDWGLAAEPAARHPSIAALLEQLGRERGWRRWRVPAIAALGVAAVVTTAVVARRGAGPDPLAACDGGAAEVGAIWNPGARDQIQRRFDRIAMPYAEVVDDQVLATLDRYRDEWSRGHKQACLDHRRGAQSAPLFDRRMTCLHRRLDALHAAAAVLRTLDATSVNNALDVATGMPRLADCADAAMLLADAEPPATADVRAGVAALRAKLSEAEALERAGRSGDALQAAGALVVRAEQLGYAPALIEALLVQGRLLLFRAAFAEAAPPLHRAEELALAHGLLTQAVTAAARRIFVEGKDEKKDRETLLHHAAVLEPLSRSLAGDHFARPLLLNNIGFLHQTLARPAEARQWFERARQALAGVAEPDLELTCIDRNLAMLTADARARDALIRGVWRRRRDQLGPYHLLTLEAQWSIAYYVADPAIARPEIEQVCDAYRTYHPELVGERAKYEHYLAFVTAETGDLEAATARYADAAAIAVGTTDDVAIYWGRLSAGYASLYRGDHADAATQFGAAIANAGDDTVWARERAANGHLGAGLTEVARGRWREAETHLERAVAFLAEVVDLAEDMEGDQRLALARVTLAGLLRRQGAEARAIELERAAARFYREASPTTYAWRLASLPP